jgi:hypothetical protein
MDNPIESEINKDAKKKLSTATGVVSAMALKYDLTSSRLLGFLLSLSYDEMRVVTCDAWKTKCGGVPRNSFAIVRANPKAAGVTNAGHAGRLILARITESVPTPVETEIQNTIFQVHKVQAMLDPLTNKELQWGALRATILGTYYDEEGKIAFGNDVDTFLAPHSYEVYVPEPKDLEKLINSFVQTASPVKLGSLRYTETPTPEKQTSVEVLVDPLDFVGRESGNRTALFGKTRMGKSNAIKLISDTIFASPAHAAQLIFDPSGEYTYINPQDDGSSLFAIHREKSVRFSLSPRLSDEEKHLGLSAPFPFKINFFANPQVGHALVVSLFPTKFPSRPNYVADVLDWEPPEPGSIPAKPIDASRYCRDWRELGIWWAVLDAAAYVRPADAQMFANVAVELKKEVKEHLAAQSDIPSDVRIDTSKRPHQIEPKQPLSVLRWIYKRVGMLFESGSPHFPDGNGGPYFSKGAQSLLKILVGSGISGTTYFRPFAVYHDVKGSDVFSNVVAYLESGKSVFIDYSNAPEEVVQNLSERIATRVFSRMVDLFSSGKLGEKFVVMYFEEAHRLFRADDKNLSSIYNRLAKEGAKFHIAMVYATQSMTTMSPDLLKNTENFIIAHLNDDREVKEVTRRYEFKDVAEDVQRVRSRGFVRMITLSHRFALPVQLDRFTPKKIQKH